MSATCARQPTIDLKEINGPLELHNEHHRLDVPWMKLYWLVGRKYFQVVKRVVLSHLWAHTVRDKQLVSSKYESAYGRSNEEYTAQRNRRRDVFLVNNHPIYTDGWFIIRSYTEALLRIIDQVDIDSVLEVGSGRGKNLALLALQRSNLRFSGLELTKHGVLRGKQLAADLPPEFLKVAGCNALTEEQREALARISFFQGSALEMSFPDKTFDLSYTCLVLEQLPEQYTEVLQEMRRVTSKYCVFIEPFIEANNSLGKAYLSSVDYFRASYKIFARFGLEPVYFTTALPQKMRYKAALLVTRVRD